MSLIAGQFQTESKSFRLSIHGAKRLQLSKSQKTAEVREINQSLGSVSTVTPGHRVGLGTVSPRRDRAHLRQIENFGTLP